MRGNPITPESADVGHFGWEPCGLTIVKQDGTKVLQCHADTTNQFNLNVQLSRDLAWDNNKRSWRWHKTWRVPDCLITADVNALHGIADLEAHLAVVCQAELPHHLEDAGVQSLDRSNQVATLQLVDGRCRFSRLRLVATTSTFGGRLFHFVVSIVKRENNSTTALASVISTAFAVYSRKNADKKRKAIDREAMISGRWSEGYSFVPFEPKELDRTFIKKTTNAQGVLVEEEITNSWDGLLAYFQAPNIRFKIRHPLFLAIRFSNVLVILRDALRFPQESEEALRSFICSCGFPLNCRRDPAVKIGHGEFLPPWLIAFRSAAAKKCNQSTLHKLADLMKVVKGPALGFVPDDSLLPQRYSPTFDVASLGQLYTKLYAIEFAAAVGDDDGGGAGGGENTHSNTNDEDSGCGGDVDGHVRDSGGGDSSIGGGGTKMRAKRAKTKMEPVQADGLVGFHPCGTPIFRPDGGDCLLPLQTGNEMITAADVDLDSSSASSPARTPSSALMRSSFESYFIALHGELRMLLQKVVELVSQCVTQQDCADVENLRKAYADFTEALSVHAYVEEHVLFKKLSDRVPNVTESYTVDHALEKGRLDEISNIMKKMDARKITELFLKISELAAVHRIHMDKEEVHLLPYFLKNFDDSEISELIGQCQSTINAKLHEHQQQHQLQQHQLQQQQQQQQQRQQLQQQLHQQQVQQNGTTQVAASIPNGRHMTVNHQDTATTTTTTTTSLSSSSLKKRVDDDVDLNANGVHQGATTTTSRLANHVNNTHTDKAIVVGGYDKTNALNGMMQTQTQTQGMLNSNAHDVHAAATMNGGGIGLSSSSGGGASGIFHDKDGDKISLLNPRHQNAIERALRAAGMAEDSDSADADVECDGDVDIEPPDIIDDRLFYEQPYTLPNTNSNTNKDSNSNSQSHSHNSNNDSDSVPIPRMAMPSNARAGRGQYEAGDGADVKMDSLNGADSTGQAGKGSFDFVPVSATSKADDDGENENENENENEEDAANSNDCLMNNVSQGSLSLLPLSSSTSSLVTNVNVNANATTTTTSATATTIPNVAAMRSGRLGSSGGEEDVIALLEEMYN